MNDIEGSTSCYCPVSVGFLSLARGTWTVQVAGVSCSVKVNPGAGASVTLYSDGRAGVHVP